MPNPKHGGRREGAGRKPQGAAAKETTSISLDPAVLAAARRAAAREGISLSALIERRLTMRTFTYSPISPADVSATDLRDVLSYGGAVKAYSITIYDATGTRPAPESAEAVYAPIDGRLGIAWGGDATWADVRDVESGIEMWLNDGDAWDAAN